MFNTNINGNDKNSSRKQNFLICANNLMVSQSLRGSRCGRIS